MGNTHPHHVAPKSPRDDTLKEAIVNLPFEISQFYNRKKGAWVRYQNGRLMEIFYQEFTPENPQFEAIQTLIEKYLDHAPGLTFTKITTLYNEKHITAFYKKWASSITSEKDTSCMNAEEKHSYDMYQKIVDRCSFNTDKFANPIIMTCHGTEQLYALEMAISDMTSIGTASGSFGEGFYSCVNPMYTFPYFKTTRQPSLLISWLLPGDVSFITSNEYNRSISKKKFVSNFVCLDQEGEINSDYKKNKFCEIIISNQSQLLPCFIVEFAKENFLELEKTWNRAYTDPKVYQSPTEVLKIDVDLESETMQSLYHQPNSDSIEDKDTKLKKLI